MPFTLKETHLRRLCEINYFPVSGDSMVFFGIRGGLPANVTDHQFRLEQSISLAELNYTNPRCTLGQWLPEDKTIAVFPGSTVPFKNYIGVKATNQLLTGYYKDFRKDKHSPSPANEHDAFKMPQGSDYAYRRTFDDKDFETDDKIEHGHPHDNLHAAYTMAVTGHYSSAGCQVVVGFPKCKNPSFTPEGGPWKTFKANAYARTVQQSYPYILLDAKDVAIMADNEGNKMQARLRFGSKGELVKSLQGALKVKGYLSDEPDGSFGVNTLLAVLKFQTDKFGITEATGVVGERSASQLGIEWVQL